MSHQSIRVLGPFQVSLDGEPVSGFASDKVRALLAYLALSPDRPHRREALAGLLWPEFPERSARNSLRNALANLRQVIRDRDASAPILHSTRQTIQFNGRCDYWLDAVAFEGLLALNPPTSEKLEEAVGLVWGMFLEGFTLADAAPFEEWLLLRREYFCRREVAALDSLCTIYEGHGAHEKSLVHARRRVELEPWQEDGQRQLMRLLARSGHRSEALAQYEKLCSSLQEDLGAEPSEDTRALGKAILSGRFAPEPGLRPDPPVPVWNLPASPTPFFGREDELAALEAMLARPEVRLVTLTGLGGSGKTRLALAVGARLGERERQGLAEQSSLTFRHGIVFVPLAALDSVEGLVAALADALQFRLEGGQEKLLQLLRRRQLLLILDNLEQLLAAAKFLAEILRFAPGVKILATSRERLRIQGEHVLSLGGLPYPDDNLKSLMPEALEMDASVSAYPALQLLADGVRRVRSEFTPSAADLPAMLDICRLVDGLPLALELASSWADSLSLSDILDETQRSLDFLQVDWPDLPTRQRSMRAVFDASWQRLKPAEQTVFPSLSVFRGGLTREAARQVVAGAEATPHVLATLVRKSFLHYDQATDRYQIHELLRQYGAEKLAQEPARDAEVHDRHSRFFCAWLQPRGPDLLGGRQEGALTEIGTELENARAACLWAAASGRAERINQAWYALGLYYRWTWAFEAGDAIFRALAQSLAAVMGPTAVAEEDRQLAVARIRLWLCVFASFRGNMKESRRFGQEGLAILNSPILAHQDSRLEEAFFYSQLGYAVIDTEPEEARRFFAQGHTLYEELDDRVGIAMALASLGRVARDLGNLEEAEHHAAESLRLRRATGNEIGASESLSLLGEIAVWQGRFARAEIALKKSLSIRQNGNTLNRLGHALLLAGRFAEAEVPAAESAAQHLDLGTRRMAANSSITLGQCHQHLGDYPAARVRAQDALSEAQRVDYQRGVGMSLGLLGAVALAEKAYEKARDRSKESLAVWQQAVGHPSEFEGEWACLSLAARGMGHRDEAWKHILAQLVWAQESQMLIPALFGLAGVTLLLSDEGQAEQALEMYALASRHPFVAKSRWFKDVVGNQLTGMAATLPLTVVTASRERGQGRDLDATVAELLSGLRR